MNGDGISTCVHCGRRVVRAVCPPDVWVHSATTDVNCEQTVATPVLTETPAVLTGQVEIPGSE